MTEYKKANTENTSKADYRKLHKFQDFIQEFIISLLPGTLLIRGRYAKYDMQKRCVFSHYSCKFYIDKRLFIEIKKQVPFRKQEKDIIEYLLTRCIDKTVHLNPFKNEISHGLIAAAISETVGGGSERVVKKVIDLYGNWASQTYEGNRITHAIGINPQERLHRLQNCSLTANKDDDALKVLGSGHNSLMILNKDGEVVDIEVLPQSANTDRILAPLSFSHIAEWADDDKIAIALTRNGEILIFKNRQLQFAKRRGAWRYFPHDVLLSRIINLPKNAGFAGLDSKVRRAIHLTAMDLAFTRGGACLGVILPNTDIKALITDQCISSDEDKLYRRIFGRLNFCKMHRALRAELCAVDGATILDCDGTIRFSGAILNTSGNPKGGGGRTAAATRLSEYGLGVKVSNDGYITLFPKDYTENEENFEWG